MNPSYFSAMLFKLGILIVIGLSGTTGLAEASSEKYQLEIVGEGLEHPWSFAFLPNGEILVTELHGNLRIVDNQGAVSKPLAGVPAVSKVKQGGLMDVVLHPRFLKNKLIYLSYTAAGEGGYGTEVARAELGEGGLRNTTIIFRAIPKRAGGLHFGSRLLFHPDGSLFVTLGDRGHRPNGQDLETHPGSIVRINDDGAIPGDNPSFPEQKKVRSEIYSYGHRNVQGIVFDDAADAIWTHEHGPQGGGELNLIKAGANYGWAQITHGKNYYTGTDIGEGEYREGVERAVYEWTPSIAPSGMALYKGSAIPNWEGDLFVGSLKFNCLVRLKMDGLRVIGEERLLEEFGRRIRDVRLGLDGHLYILTDEKEGVIARLVPAVNVQ